MALLLRALNRLIWKLPKVEGCKNADEVAVWWIAELFDAGIKDIGWNTRLQRFVKKGIRKGARVKITWITPAK